MPIYTYKCDSCGFDKDVLQKMSAPLLTDCPVCGAATFKKQLTAARFRLTGSGWYATDFKGGKAHVPADSAQADAPAGSAATAPTPASVPTAAPAAAASVGCAGDSACACH